MNRKTQILTMAAASSHDEASMQAFIVAATWADETSPWKILVDQLANVIRAADMMREYCLEECGPTCSGVQEYEEEIKKAKLMLKEIK